MTNLNVAVKAGKTFLLFRRVSYGEKETPMEEREYRLQGVSKGPVGTRREIKEFMQKITLKDKFDGVLLVDKKDGDPAKNFQECILTDKL